METIPEKKRKSQILFTVIFICALIAAVTVCSISFGGERRIPVYSVDTSEKKVAISFDAAWGDEYTAGILDILDTYDVKATFFLVNFWAEKYPDDVKMIAEKGHDIGNHSTSHPDMADLSAEEIKNELNTTAATIESLTGKRPVLFRPPYGSYSDTLIECAESLGYTTIQWDVDSLDWKDIGTEQIVERVTRNVKNGSIVLFHNNAEHVLEYLPLILENFKQNGYEVVKINDLIYHDNCHVNEQGRQVSDGAKSGKSSSDGAAGDKTDGRDSTGASGSDSANASNGSGGDEAGNGAAGAKASDSTSGGVKAADNAVGVTTAYTPGGAASADGNGAVCREVAGVPNIGMVKDAAGAYDTGGAAIKSVIGLPGTYSSEGLSGFGNYLSSGEIWQ